MMIRFFVEINSGVITSLKIIREVDKPIDSPYRHVLVQCSCGHLMVKIFSFVKRGKIRSCRKCQSKKHGEDIRRVADEKGRAHHRLSNIWSGIKVRCNNDSHHSKYHKVRGIKICDEWVNDRKAFEVWSLSNGYKDDLSIDRIDNDGDYTPDNCRWTTHRQQTLNSRVRNDNKSGERCISPLRGKFQLTIDGKYIAIFKCISDAVIARDKIISGDRIVD